MGDLSGAKVGDHIFVSSAMSMRGHIDTVARITPSGRIILKKSGSVFTPDGRRYGTKSSWNTSWARIATEDDIAGAYRYGLVEKLRRFDWSRLSTDELNAVAATVSAVERREGGSL